MKCPHCKNAFEPTERELHLSGDRLETMSQLKVWRHFISAIVIMVMTIVGAIVWCTVATHDPAAAESAAHRKWTAELEVLRQYIHETDKRLSQ